MAVAVENGKNVVKTDNAWTEINAPKIYKIRRVPGELYNIEQKNRYKETIEERQYPNGYWDRLFLALSFYEEKYRKDAYNFNKVEIRNMYGHLNYTSYESLMVDNYNLSKYTMWAISKSLVEDGINHYADFTQEELVNCVNLRQLKQSIVSREMILSGMNEINNAQDRFILLAVFEGIRGKEFDDLRSLKIEDIDLVNNTAKLKCGKTITISNELKNLAVEANDEETYINSKRLKLDLTGSYILKVNSISYTKSGEEKKKQRNIYDSFLRSASTLGWSDQISINSLHTSGIIDMINRLAKENGMTGKDVLYNNKMFEGICDRYDLNPLVRKRFLLKYGDMLV